MSTQIIAVPYVHSPENGVHAYNILTVAIGLAHHSRPTNARSLGKSRDGVRTRIWCVYAKETSIKIACDKTDELPGARFPIGWRLAIDVTRGWGYDCRDVRRVRACVRMTP